MKPDMLICCILATIFSSSIHHVASFLNSQAASTAARAATATAAFSKHQQQHQHHQQQQQQQLQHSRNAPLYAGVGYLNAGIDAAGGGTDMGVGNGAAFQSAHMPLDSQERGVYDPGDDLLRALNAEYAATGQELGTSPEEPDYADTVYNELEVASKYEMLRKLEEDLREEQDLVDKSALLMKMLEDPSIDTLPIVYVEEAPTAEEFNEIDYPPVENGISKRSRYYRRFPWKRHTRNRGNYEPELRYACTPSKEDIFKLLLNLHENRKGNHSKTVNFCNRKRPAKAVFTNIRFLG